MSCIERKFGHSAHKKIKRDIEPITTLLKSIKKMEVTANEVNLVINNPIYLIGGPQQPYDQGQLGSCTANALAFTTVFNEVKQNYVPFMPSRLDIYYNERLHFGGSRELTLDEGANISDCEYVLENVGIIPEEVWKYSDKTSSPLFYSIPKSAKNIPKTLALSKNTMYSLNPSDLNTIKSVLSNGYPIICGMIVDIDVFCSQATACTGIITKLPNLRRGNLAGHAVVIVGYTSDGFFLVRNSWGVNWGLGFLNQSTGVYNYDEFGGKMRGYFKLPTAYVTNPQLMLEMYVVKEMSNTNRTIANSINSINTSLDSTFVQETTVRPIGTVFKTLTIPSAKMNIYVSYYVNPLNNKYIWVLKSTKIVSSGEQVLFDIEINSLNYFDSTVKAGFYNKSAFVTDYVTGASIALGRGDQIAAVVSINTINGKLSLLSSVKI